MIQAKYNDKTLAEKVALRNSRTVPRRDTFLDFSLNLDYSKAKQPFLHRFAESLAKLLDPNFPGFPGGTVSKVNSADHRTLRSTYGPTNSQRYPGAKSCNCLIRIQQQLIYNPLVKWQPV